MFLTHSRHRMSREKDLDVQAGTLILGKVWPLKVLLFPEVLCTEVELQLEMSLLRTTTS